MNTFVKYEGAGNDFILIDDRLQDRLQVFSSERILQLCHRRFGVGADGVILLQLSQHADFRMRIFNSDGTEAESCGNGLRCLGRFLLDLGLAETNYSIEIMDRIVQIDYVDDLVAVDMGEPKDIKLHLETERGAVHYVDTGVSHAIHFVENAAMADMRILGPFFRHHPLFGAKGANANIASLCSDGSIHVRTFERGVEGETLACGTGACAVAVIAAKLYGLTGPIAIIFPGGQLQISFKGGKIVMAGPARRVFKGEIESLADRAVKK